MIFNPLIPGHSAPMLSLPTLDGNIWTLANRKPDNFTMVVFYRGRHCPNCEQYLKTLEPLVPAFDKAGVDVLAVSCDGEAQAKSAKDDWGLEQLTIGYALSTETARTWGLFLTQSRRRLDNGELETFTHSEPGLYLIRPDSSIFLSSVQTSVFGRASMEEMLKATHFLRGKDISPPGTLTI